MLVDLTCGYVELAPGEATRLTPEVLDALRVGGLPTTLFAYIGMLG